MVQWPEEYFNFTISILLAIIVPTLISATSEAVHWTSAKLEANWQFSRDAMLDDVKFQLEVVGPLGEKTCWTLLPALPTRVLLGAGKMNIPDLQSNLYQEEPLDLYFA